MISQLNLPVSLVESFARDRARILLDEGSAKELLGPFDQFESPHLEAQNIVPQSDDGMVIMQGTIKGRKVLIISIEGSFQGGGIGEISGAKFAGALEKALESCQNGEFVYPVIIYDTGGVRLQEANYGLLSIAEISSVIVALKQYVPVIGIIPGKIGSFGGMSLTAGLCSRLIMTREGRLGMNGPEVVEQEAGVKELNAKQKPLIWQMIGGHARKTADLVDLVVEDDAVLYIGALEQLWNSDNHATRTMEYDAFLQTFLQLDVSSKIAPTDARGILKDRHQAEADASIIEDSKTASRGRTWFEQLTKGTSSISDVPSVLVADAPLGNKTARFIAVVPNEANPFYRARNGEFGLLEAWTVAKYVREAIQEDADADEKRIIVPIVDVPGQAFGYHEELFGIYLACAASVEAYAVARQSGHPVVTCIVGKAISGAFLSHGMQANRIIALNDEAIQVHVMSKKSAALVTMRTVEELDEFAKAVPSMAYDIDSFNSLGAVASLIDGVQADAPTAEDVQKVVDVLIDQVNQVITSNDVTLKTRLDSPLAKTTGRVASIAVREKITEQWK
ncbi:MAG: biotin-independent malonate decarboxylase subunit beta [Solibacillus sp.]